MMAWKSKEVSRVKLLIICSLVCMAVLPSKKLPQSLFSHWGLPDAVDSLDVQKPVDVPLLIGIMMTAVKLRCMLKCRKLLGDWEAIIFYVLLVNVQSGDFNVMLVQIVGRILIFWLCACFMFCSGWFCCTNWGPSGTCRGFCGPCYRPGPDYSFGNNGWWWEGTHLWVNSWGSWLLSFTFVTLLFCYIV